MKDAPPGWSVASLGDLLVELRNGVFVSRPGTDNTGRPILRISAVRPMTLRDDDVRYVPAAAVVANEANSRLEAGDLLFTRYSGNPEYVGACARIRHPLPGLLYPDKLIRGRVIPGLIDPGYLEAMMSAPQTRAVIRHVIKTTAGQVGISGSDLRSIPVPLAPYREQLRIVTAIEEQFSRLDTGVAALIEARRRLEQLRDQGILALIAGKGRKVLLAEVADIRLGRQRSPKNHAGPNMVPYLRAANVTWDGLDLTDVKQMNFAPSEVSTYRLQRGDVLVAEASGSASEVGKPAIWDESLAVCCFQNTLLRLRSQHLLPEYLYLVILALARSGAFARASKGVGIHHLSKTGLANVKIEVPPVTMQHELVATIIERQQWYAALDSAISMGLKRASRLRSSILASAYSGNLVKQVSDDEPASTLLERIASERAFPNGRNPARIRTPRTSQEKVVI